MPRVLKPLERPVRKHPEGFEWRYLIETVVHAHPVTGVRFVAACGTAPGWLQGIEDWKGTGTQNEYEIAARLRECRRCLKIIKAKPDVLWPYGESGPVVATK